ncbi:MAG TPA: Smr/MutS family protein [Saprospiraceae bacterium]|nr:Smr/MutS family protein [Saprospiraceae bacterium]
MDLKTLWIGDRVEVLSSSNQGKFEGISKDGRARVRIGDKIFLVTADNLKTITEAEYFPDIHEFLKNDNSEAKKVVPLKIKFDHTLDLHLEKLAPHMQNELPARILEFQVQKSEVFIREAISKKYPHITIIHGKGAGVLKEQIEAQLKGFPQVRFTFSKNGGGAVEVWLD